jgi:hypothetical protein
MTPLEALQRALAAEHAATYVLGALGARTSASASPGLYAEVVACYEAHRDRRDRLVELVGTAGAEPEPAEPAYSLPAELGSPDAVTRAALEVETRVAASYAWLVEQTTGEERRFAVTSLTDTAVRALAFRGSPEILPGMASTRTARR